MSSTFPRPPLPHKELQRLVRNGLPSAEARRFWWPLLVKLGHHENLNEAIDVREQAKRRYIWVQQSLASSKNKEKEIVANVDIVEEPQAVTAHIVPLLMQQFDIKEPALFLPLVRILSTVLTNSVLCFSTCCDILERPGWFSAPDAITYRTKLVLFRELVQMSVPKLYAVLEGIGALEDRFLSLIFLDHFSTLLTLEQRYRFIDIYLLEGSKAIFRFGIGLLKVYKPRIKGNQFPTGEAFWNSLVSHCGTSSGVSIDELVAQSVDANRGFFQRKCVPSREVILALENQIKADNHFSNSSLNLPIPPELSTVRPVTGGEGIHPSQSRLLDAEAGAILNSFLPPNARMEGFELMFATYNDGWSFDGLYHQVAHLSPCVILIKALNSQALIGMYLTTPISPPSFAITGDGQCFCFRLNGESASKYEWIPPAERSPTHRHPNSTTSSSTWDQFALCAPTYMAFGGSEKHGSNAIRLDSDLSVCATGHSDTYHNPPLVHEEKNSNWAVMDVEVFCGKSLVLRKGLTPSTSKK